MNLDWIRKIAYLRHVNLKELPTCNSKKPIDFTRILEKFLCRIEDLARSYRFLLGVGSCKGREEDDMFERIFNQSLQSIFVKNHNSQHFPMGATYFMKHFLQKKTEKNKLRTLLAYTGDQKYRWLCYTWLKQISVNNKIYYHNCFKLTQKLPLIKA